MSWPWPVNQSLLKPGLGRGLMCQEVVKYAHLQAKVPKKVMYLDKILVFPGSQSKEGNRVS